jgi:hypothetical protein
MPLASKTGSQNLLSLYLLIAITAAYCLWVLSLPLFPTMDGPMHLYYIHVIRSLFARTPNVYQSYYYIKHLLPPYSGYYYTQIALSKVFPDLVADKLVICFYFILFAFGFRYLATAIGPSGEWMALLATPLLLSWPLGMGFVNYLLSLAAGMWAIGLWWRAGGTGDNKKKILFVVLVYVAMFSHPIPLLFIVGYGFVELFVRVLGRGKQSDKALYDKYLRQDAGYLLFACGSFLYVKLFTLSNPMQQSGSARGGIHAFSDHAFEFLHLLPLAAFKGNDIETLLYNTALTLILIVPLGLALRALWRNVKAGEWTKSDTWIALCVLAIIVLPAVPSEVNHAYQFAERLVIVVWLSATAAGSVYVARSRNFGRAVIVFALVINAMILAMAQSRIAPIAKQIARIQDVPVQGTGSLGLVLMQEPYERPTEINYDPFYWAGAHYFRLHDKVLYNSPWLQLPTIPLGAKPTMTNGKIDASVLENLRNVRRTIDSSEDYRNLFLSNVSFVLITSGLGPRSTEIDPILVPSRQTSANWDCKSEDWFRFCDRDTTISQR